MITYKFDAALEKPLIPVSPSAWLGHIPFGLSIVAALRPRVVVELGTHYGHSYFTFCQAIDRWEIDCQAYAVDTWAGDEHAGQYGEEIFASVQRANVRYERFSRLLRMTFDAAADYFSDGSIDMLHIDGLHTYEAVKGDFELWRSKMSSRGVILFHDINVRERGFGVWRLWEQLRGQYPHIEFMHSHGLGVLFIGTVQTTAALELIRSWNSASERASILRYFETLGHLVGVDRQLAEREADLARLSADLSQHTAANRALQTQTDELRSELNSREDELRSEINIRDGSIEEKNAQITILVSQLRQTSESTDFYKTQVETLAHQLAVASAQISSANQHALSIEASLTAVLHSTSWRASRPIRWLGTRLKNAKAVHALVPAAVESAGGKLNLTTKLLATFSREGWRGIKRRVVAFDAVRRSPPPMPQTDSRSKKFAKSARQSSTGATESADIIVCVHNALDDVKICLNSILSYTIPPYQLILVDDGSATDTRIYLENFARAQGCTLLRHDVAKGYTLAANAGLRSSKADYTILLNSDTIVSADWLPRMINCAKANDVIGMVGPLSNTASWQSVPHLMDEQGDWATNPLPPSVSVQEMARRVASLSSRMYPQVGFLNGFCLLIKRALINDIGIFDEDNFGEGYGEENDFCLRAVSAGWQLAVADDVYVYHSQSKSYSSERRLKLAQASDKKLHMKHGSEQIMKQLEITRFHPGLAAIRARIALSAEVEATRAGIRQDYEGRRILVVLPVAQAGGGANVILSEALVLQQCGVDVVLVNSENHRASFNASYPACPIPVIWVREWEELYAHVCEYDAVIATLYSSVFWIRDAISRAKNSAPKIGYYIQDFEPNFFDVCSPQYAEALASYTAMQMCLVTKTQWNQRMVAQHTGLAPLIIGPSCDTKLFAPSATVHKPQRPTICAMVRPSTPRRAPHFTVHVLQQVLLSRTGVVDVKVFGCDVNDPALNPLVGLNGFTAQGELTQEKVAEALREADIFIDLSVYQAMGMTCMEAMSSGAAIIGPLNGGLGEIVENGESGLLVDTRSSAECVNACLRLVDDEVLRSRLAQTALLAISQFPPEKSASNLVKGLFSELN